MDDLQSEDAGDWGWQARERLVENGPGARLSPRQEFIPGVWAEWPSGSVSGVSFQHRSVDSGVSTVPAGVVSVLGITRYFRLFFSIEEVKSAALRFSLVARSMHKPLNGRLRIACHSKDKGWRPADQHVVGLPLSKFWTRSEATLPIPDLKSRTALMWECNGDEALICIGSMSIAGSAGAKPLIAIRPVQVGGKAEIGAGSVKRA